MIQMEVMRYLWIAVIFLATFTEAMSFSLVAVWFIPSALVALVLSFFDIAVWVQVLVFFALSFVLLITVRKWSVKLLKVKNTPTNADAVIGKEAVVTEEIDNLRSTGQVRIDGKLWTARSAGSEQPIPTGTVVEVIRIEGVKAMVSPRENHRDTVIE